MRIGLLLLVSVLLCSCDGDKVVVFHNGKVKVIELKMVAGYCTIAWYDGYDVPLRKDGTAFDIVRMDWKPAKLESREYVTQFFAAHGCLEK